MRIKRLLALVLSAAMAVTLFAGCCSPSLLQLLLDLLQEQYQNITVTAEDDLDAALREAVSEYDTLEEMDAALAQTLGKTVEFESLRSARAGDKAFDLVYRTGTDTEAMARLTYTEWNKILGSLPASGQYLADLAVRKAGGGYYILVDITVKKGSSSGGNHNSGDDEEENSQPVDPTPTLKDYEWDKENENTILVHTNKGLQQVFFENMTGKDDTLMTARAGGFEDITIKLDSRDDYVVTETFEPDFRGYLTSTETNTPATIHISIDGMFKEIGASNNNDNGISYVNFKVSEMIPVTYTHTDEYAIYQTNAGIIAGINNGTISHCNVSFQDGAGMQLEFTADQTNEAQYVAVQIGGITGVNYGTIEFCTVSGGSIEADITISKNGQLIDKSEIENESIINYLVVGGITGANTWRSPENVKECDNQGANITVRCNGNTYTPGPDTDNGAFISDQYAISVGNIIGQVY